jgi:hypothetical protein
MPDQLPGAAVTLALLGAATAGLASGAGYLAPIALSRFSLIRNSFKMSVIFTYAYKYIYVYMCNYLYTRICICTYV